MREKFGYKPGDFPIAEYVAARTLALPFYNTMTGNQVDEVCTKMESILEKVLIAKKR